MPEVAAHPLPQAPLRFGRFELQPRERRLLVDGVPATLGSRAFDLLLMLAARPDQLVTKGELLDLVWPGLVVEESNLHTQMSALRKVLGGEVIATVPGRGYRFTAQREPGAQPAAASPATAGATPAAPASQPSSASAARSAIPTPGGRLIARETDLAQLEDALRTPGLVTLAGAGGVGKTRLALTVSQRWPARCEWVDLAPLAEGEQVAGALARSLGLTVADADAAPQVARALAGNDVLLVLDNAEHLVEATAALAASLLGNAPALRLLVTSQMPLALRGERVLHLEPLPIEKDGAMALLVDRIGAADHRVRLGDDAAPVLRDICLQLDGLPLALEMAAARVPLLGLTGVRDELAQRFALLTKGHRQSAPRHRTLHAALDWSYNLLGADEQKLFARLGVFAGGFTLDLCVGLMTGTGGDAAGTRWDVIDRLAALVDRSLVAVGTEEPPRYRLLETMRAYALEQLDASGDADAIHRRHLLALIDYLPDNSVDAARMLRGAVEFDNVREAFAWARAHDIALAVRLIVHASLVATFTSWRAQCYAWMESLEAEVDAPANATALALGLRVRWWTEYARCSVSSMSVRAPAVSRRARALARTHDDPALLFIATAALARGLPEPSQELDEACAEVTALMKAHPEWPARMRLIGTGALSNAANVRNDPEALLGWRYEEMKYAREAGNPRSVDAVETNIGFTLQALKRHEEALVHFRAVAGRVAGQSDANLAWALHGVLESLITLGRLDEARTELPAAATANWAVDLPLHTPSMAMLALGRGRHESAARLLGYARRSFESRSMRFGQFSEMISETERQLLPELGAERVKALETEGRTLTDAEAFELVTGD